MPEATQDPKHHPTAFVILGGIAIAGFCIAIPYLGNNYIPNNPDKEPTVREVRRRELKNLETKILKKAEMVDGELGLSFREVSRLAHELGYRGIVQQGDYFSIGLIDEYSDNPQLRVTLFTPGIHNFRHFKVDEKVARKYVGEGV